jgi:Nucleotidyltransferase domain
MNDSDSRPDLKELVEIFVKWARPAKGAKVYLFGSRVRGDHEPDSDVDMIVDFVTATDEATDWWTATNGIHFADLAAELPGPVHNPRQYTEELLRTVRASKVIFQQANVYCVWTPPKPK